VKGSLQARFLFAVSLRAAFPPPERPPGRFVARGELLPDAPQGLRHLFGDLIFGREIFEFADHP
jgi:hypothetical protein